VTIGELIKSGKLLEVHCSSCRPVWGQIRVLQVNRECHRAASLQSAIHKGVYRHHVAAILSLLPTPTRIALID
jgi:hypothetical protein